MTQRAPFDKIELSWIRVLHTLIDESSVSRTEPHRTALRLHSTQPMVSAQLKKLRDLAARADQAGRAAACSHQDG